MPELWPMQGPTTRVRIEGDIVAVQSIGVTTREDMVLIFQAYALVRQEHGVVLALYDARLGKGMTAEARKDLMAVTSPEKRADATAVYGASFAIRALVNMLDRASVLLMRKPVGATMFATESEARAYLAQQRIRLRSKLQ